MEARLGAISASSDDVKARGEAYKAVLDEALASGDAEACKQFVDHVASEAVPLVLGRQLLMAFAQGLPQLPAEAQLAAATHALERTAPRAVSYEEQSALVRERLAALHEAGGRFSAAAAALAGIDLDSGVRRLEPEYRLATCVRVATLYLEGDDAGAAEPYVARAAAMLGAGAGGAPADGEPPEAAAARARRLARLELQHKGCAARVLDANRRFLEAAQRYHELSLAGGAAAAPGPGGAPAVDEADLLHALGAACACAILAAAGPRRARVLAALHRDERARALPVFPTLERVYLERLLSPAEVAAFAATLRPHQLATLGDGSTVLERAVAEHNLQAASRLYAAIRVADLAALLGVPPDKAEAAAVRMVGEGRLAAAIDQVDGLVTFGGAPEPLAAWDGAVAALCRRVDALAETLAAVEAAAAPGGSMDTT